MIDAFGVEISKAETPAWQRSEGKNPKGGLNAKGRASARAQGMNLKAPVKGGDNPRRASFLARMGNMPGPERKPNGEPTRLLLSLQAWGASSKADAKKKAAFISSKNDSVSKGLPSYVKGVQLGKIKPNANVTGLGRVYRANLISANAAGKKAAAMKPDNMKQRLISEIPKSFSMRNRPREKFQAQVAEGQKLKRRLPGYLRVNKDIKAARETTKAKYDSTYLDEKRMSAQDLIWHRATNMAPRKRNVSKAFTPRNPDFSMQGREVLHLGRKARIQTYDGDNMFTVLNNKDAKVFVHRDQIKFLKKKRSGSSVKPLAPSKPPKPVQGTLFDIGKTKPIKNT
jgi:hypothetical protein